MEHAWQLDVIDVVASTGENAAVLDSMDLGPDEPHLAGSPAAMLGRLSSAADTATLRIASWTPSTIDW